MEECYAKWPLTDKHVAMVQFVRDAANVMRQGEHSDRITVTNTHEGWIAALYATRCTRNLMAVAALCEAGLASEAAPVLRAMLEDAVNVAYIEQDKERRAAQYVAFEEKRAYFYMKEALRSRLIDEDSERAQELTAKYGNAEQLNTLWWAGVSAGGMAGKLKGESKALKRDFFAMYPLLSDDAHGNAMCAKNYVVNDENQRVIAIVDAPTQHRVAEMTSSAIYCAWRLAAAAESCGLGVVASDIEDILVKASDVYRQLEPEDAD